MTLDPTTDSTVEPDETAILTVVSGASYDVGIPASATGTITNDDTDVTVAVAPSSVEEDGAPNLVYTFTRNGVTAGALTVNFTINGTATLTMTTRRPVRPRSPLQTARWISPPAVRRRRDG